MKRRDGDSGGTDPLVDAVRLRKARRAGWLREGDPSVAHRLAQIGVLGWIVVVPMLAGVFAGRWLDRAFGSGIVCTAPLLMLGAALGCWTAWTWIKDT